MRALVGPCPVCDESFVLREVRRRPKQSIRRLFQFLHGPRVSLVIQRIAPAPALLASRVLAHVDMPDALEGSDRNEIFAIWLWVSKFRSSRLGC